MVGDTVDIVKGEAVIKGLLEGSRLTADAVATTFGPYGNNVAITMKYNVPVSTNDGARVASYIKLKDPVQNVAAQLINQSASETAKVAGDGTTSTTIFTATLVKNAFKYLKAGSTSMQLRRDFKIAEALLLEHLRMISTAVAEKDIKSIAMVACNSDEEMADLVTEAFKIVGENGVVTVTDSRSYTTSMDATDGIKLDRSHIIPSLSNGELSVKHKDCAIAVLDLDITTTNDALHILGLQESLGGPLLIICNDLTGSAAEIISFNKAKYKLPIEVIRAPFISEARKEACIDLAIVTGAKLLAKYEGWSVEDLAIEHFGSSENVELTNKETNIIGRLGNQEDIDKRVQFYTDKIEADKEGLAENYKKRLAFFTSGAAVIYVGGVNESEIGEKKDRLDDTIRAVRSAMSDGYVIGGCLTYHALASYLRDNHSTPANLIMADSLDEIINVLLGNSGCVTYDEHYESVIKNTILDPTLVIKSTIQNAIGAAIVLFTTNCVIIRIEE